MIPRPVLAVIAGCMMLAATVAGFVYGAITTMKKPRQQRSRPASNGSLTAITTRTDSAP